RIEVAKHAVVALGRSALVLQSQPEVERELSRRAELVLEVRSEIRRVGGVGIVLGNQRIVVQAHHEGGPTQPDTAGTVDGRVAIVARVAVIELIAAGGVTAAAPGPETLTGIGAGFNTVLPADVLQVAHRAVDAVTGESWVPVRGRRGVAADVETRDHMLVAG